MQKGKFFTINGYWKNDKEPIREALISVDCYECDVDDLNDHTETNGVKDSYIFHYGLDEGEIKRIIEEGEENDQVEFVITDYSEAKMRDTNLTPEGNKKQVYQLVKRELTKYERESLKAYHVKPENLLNIFDIQNGDSPHGWNKFEMKNGLFYTIPKSGERHGRISLFGDLEHTQKYCILNGRKQ